MSEIPMAGMSRWVTNDICVNRTGSPSCERFTVHVDGQTIQLSRDDIRAIADAAGVTVDE